MIARSRALFALRRNMATQATASRTPVEDAIRAKLNSSLNPAPTILTIRNDSALHAHHKAMASTTTPEDVDRETHFHLTIVSDAFKDKRSPARHRMVYTLLKEEMERQGGIHALSLVTRTVQEEESRGGA